MNRQSWIINIVLVAVAVGLVLKVRGDWRHADDRYRLLEESARGIKAGSPSATGTTSPAALTPVAEAIVANNLFSPDRNNNVPPPTEVKPAPAEPALLGAMNLGSGPIAMMMDTGTPNSGSRQVREGDTIGGYKVVKIGDTYAMIEYEGKQKRIEVQWNVQQVNAPSQPRAANAAPASYAPQKNAPPLIVPEKVAKANDITNGTGNSTGSATTRTSADMFGPGVPDNYPAGTIKDGWRKVEKPWPFGGKQTWWEKIQ